MNARFIATNVVLLRQVAQFAVIVLIIDIELQPHLLLEVVRQRVGTNEIRVQIVIDRLCLAIFCHTSPWD